jgi:hypothetical protein
MPGSVCAGGPVEVTSFLPILQNVRDELREAFHALAIGIRPVREVPQARRSNNFVSALYSVAPSLAAYPSVSMVATFSIG